MGKIAFIIPGFLESIENPKYKRIAGYFQKAGITPQLIHIDWKRKTIEDWMKQCNEEINKFSTEERYILGFSYGAMIAFVIASQKQFKKVILCSLSPYFKEDLPTLKKYWLTSIGEKRIATFDQISSIELVKNIHSPVVMLNGTEEGTEVDLTNKRVFHQLKVPKQHILVQDAKHDLSQENYQQEIERVIQSL